MTSYFPQDPVHTREFHSFVEPRLNQGDLNVNIVAGSIVPPLPSFSETSISSNLGSSAYHQVFPDNDAFLEPDDSFEGNTCLISLADFDPSLHGFDNAEDFQQPSTTTCALMTTQYPLNQQATTLENWDRLLVDASPSNTSSLPSDISTPETLVISESQAKGLRFQCSICKKHFKRQCDLK